MQWRPISECDLDCLKKGSIVSFLLKGNPIPEKYEYDIAGVFYQYYPGGAIGKSWGVLKQQGATHFMVHDLPEGEE